MKWGTPTGATDVTMARIAAVHAAQLTVGIAKEENPNHTNLEHDCLQLSPYSYLPEPMKKTVFTSLIPSYLRQEDRDFMLDAYTVQGFNFDFKIFTCVIPYLVPDKITEDLPIAYLRF